MEKKIQLIKLNQINTDEENPREAFEEIEELANSIELNGQQEPIIVERLAKDEYLVLNGHRRHAAFTLIKKRSGKNPEVECIVEQTLTPEERLLKRCVIDSQQQNWTVPERDRSWLKIWELQDNDMSKKDFAKLIGTTTGKVSSFFDRLEIKEVLNEVEISTEDKSDVINETRGLDTEKRKKLLKMANEYDLGCREVREIKKTIKDATEVITDAVINKEITLDQAESLKGLDEERQESAIDVLRTAKKSMDEVPRLIKEETWKKKDKTEQEMKLITAQTFVDKLAMEVGKTCTQMEAVVGVLEQIEKEKLDEHFNSKMKVGLAASLNILMETIPPAVEQIKKTVDKWREE